MNRTFSAAVVGKEYENVPFELEFKTGINPQEFRWVFHNEFECSKCGKDSDIIKIYRIVSIEIFKATTGEPKDIVLGIADSGTIVLIPEDRLIEFKDYLGKKS